MRAARYYGKEDVRIEDIPKPECGEGQVRVNYQHALPPNSKLLVSFLSLVEGTLYPFNPLTSSKSPRSPQPS